MDKKEIRKHVKDSLKKMTTEEYQVLSNIIGMKLLKETSIIEGKTIAITISNFPEVETKKIIENLWELGKKVVVPKCNPVDHSMAFYAINNFNQLETVYMDLQEPIPEKTELVNSKEIDVMIVPGIVFDKKGNRIGYGGGYYDRYLEKYDGILISLAFDIQLVDAVPTDLYDLPVQLLITENNRFDCSKNRGEFKI